MSASFEINFDGLVGPTHNYSGLSWGNEASIGYQKKTSNPREAALQGLQKMKFLMDLGVKQAVLPPHERPFIPALKRMGFTGTPEAILETAKRYQPWIFRYVSSASPMWAANAANVTPSIDSANKKVQFTPANLHTKLHRSFEAETTSRILKAIFENPVFFDHHTPLISHDMFSDEGAANHIRLGKSHGAPGVHLFVYGNSRITDDEIVPQKYPARQSKEASQAIIDQHKIYHKQVVVAQQNPKAIDAGVFHNDVISLGNETLFLFHEESFIGTDNVVDQLKQKLETESDAALQPIKVSSDQVSLEQAVKSYLFNSQLVTLPDGLMTMIAPEESKNIPEVQAFLQNLAEDSSNPIHEIHYLNLRQSMQNGGGPACLRLRVVLNETELAEMNPSVLLTQSLYDQLEAWIKKHYRDKLHPNDLADLKLMEEGRAALDELTTLLNLGSIYDFQQ
ncbi:MAG: N-succinylarginine dihydrolase [Chlamydiia bacterium]|nr:N-succinylarginine dihydrolase [Chlamydiia bacterium]